MAVFLTPAELRALLEMVEEPAAHLQRAGDQRAVAGTVELGMPAAHYRALARAVRKLKADLPR